MNTYYFDYEVHFDEGSSELREESVVAVDSYQAYLQAEKLLERKEKGKTYNILDLRKLW